jgi:hypothetical protein
LRKFAAAAAGVVAALQSRTGCDATPLGGGVVTTHRKALGEDDCLWPLTGPEVIVL